MLSAAQAHFNSFSITGVQLENDDGASASFLERTVFKGEIMASGYVIPKAVLSSITAGWLLDTGWYSNINTNLIQSFEHGLNRGYTFYYNDTCNGVP